jgi:polar amino acid transport system ATP-binding protein
MRDGVVAESGPPSRVIDDPQTEATRAFLGRFNARAEGGAAQSA